MSKQDLARQWQLQVKRLIDEAARTKTNEEFRAKIREAKRLEGRIHYLLHGEEPV